MRETVKLDKEIKNEREDEETVARWRVRLKIWQLGKYQSLKKKLLFWYLFQLVYLNNNNANIIERPKDLNLPA